MNFERSWFGYTVGAALWTALVGGCVGHDPGVDRETEFQVFLTKGQAYMERNKPQQALPALREAQRIHPDNPALLTTMAMAFSALGQSQSALDALQRADALKPDDPGISHNLGVAYFQEGDLENAELFLTKATLAADFNNQASAWYNLALVYQRKVQQDRMVAALQEAIRVDPSHVASHKTLAAHYRHIHELDQERHHLETIIQLDPGDVDTLELLGINWAASGRKDQAASIFRQLMQTNPDLPATQRLRGRLLEIEQP
ncbi:MAG: tetratricopeptide repeat protein [Magnetococcales bacterium]|nr:tetratricopeptide repeat protein [Magnetococcales bacterium]